jgi:hypothetical protein
MSTAEKEYEVKDVLLTSNLCGSFLIKVGALGALHHGK